MTKRKGLRALIPTGMIEKAPPSEPGPEAEAARPGAVELPLEAIRVPKQQPRRRIAEEGLEELMDSIREHGILQPLVVRPLGAGEYELVAGERRYQAAKRLGLATAPVMVKEATDQGALEMALVENLQREDINPMDAAAAYRELMDRFELTQEQVAQRVGKSRSAVANTLRLMKLPPEVQDSIQKGEIEEGHGRALLGAGDPSLALKIWQVVRRRRMSVAQTEAAVRRALKRDVSRETKLGRPKLDPLLDPVMADLQDKLTMELNAKVIFRAKGEGGVMEVHYASWEDLDYAVRRIVAGLKSSTHRGVESERVDLP